MYVPVCVWNNFQVFVVIFFHEVYFTELINLSRVTNLVYTTMKALLYANISVLTQKIELQLKPGIVTSYQGCSEI